MAKLSDMIAVRADALDYSGLLGVLPNPDPVLRAQGKSITVYRDLRTDAHLGGCIRRRKSAVKALEWGLDRDKAPARVAKAIEAILAEIDIERLIGDCLEAVLYGYQPIEIVWGKVGTWIVPTALVAKPPEWFAFDAENRLRFKTRANPMHGDLLPDRKFLLPRQDATYQNPYGFADLSMCFWPIVFKKGGVKFWLTFTEKFGMPFLVGKQPRGTTEAERDVLLDSLEAMVADAVAVIPDDSSVEPLDLIGHSSADIYERLVMYCRSEVSIALTGTNQTVEANSNKASASAGLQVADDLRDGDAEIVAATVNQLIRWVCELNFSGVARPVWSLWDQEKQDKLRAERDKTISESGARFTNAYWVREYGYQEGDLASDAQTSSLAPDPVSPEPGAAVAASEFAESASQTPADDLANQLAGAADGPWGELIATIGDLVAATPDLPTLQARLLAAYGGLDTERLTAIMAAGFQLAELRGLADARDDVA